MTESPSEASDLPRQRVVTLRTLVLTTIAASLVTVLVAVGLSFALIGQPRPGPRGPTGEQGAQGLPGDRGRRGPAGDTQVEAEAVWEVVEGDPQRVTDLVDEESVWEVVEGDPQRVTDVVEGNLSPSPSDVASDLSSLCSDLTFTAALSSEFLSCP